MSGGAAASSSRRPNTPLFKPCHAPAAIKNPPPPPKQGPDVGGPNGPYRQSERADIYKRYVDQLVAQGVAYPCFCTDEELEAMKKDAEAKKLPPIYRGKWATASKEEVDAMLAAGTPCCYRFRVPAGEEVAIDDIVRGRVAWSTDTLGDFVILRSNGLPVYNFCVAVDDALMGITHVLRAEEHLPNTLRQVLIYKALGMAPPAFGHMSLILAPDKSKLSKRHGATSVGEFRQQGFLAPAMVNYLSLLGWNDGTEKEIYSAEELQQAFTLERITKVRCGRCCVLLLPLLLMMMTGRGGEGARGRGGEGARGVGGAAVARRPFLVLFVAAGGRLLLLATPFNTHAPYLPTQRPIHSRRPCLTASSCRG